jgi:hypothetical protein
MKHHGHTYGGFVPTISERGVTAPSPGTLPTVAVGPREAPPGETSTWEALQKWGDSAGWS